MTTEYTKLIGKDVEASMFGDNWFKGTLTGVNTIGLVTWGPTGFEFEEPVVTFEIDNRVIVGQIRSIRKFKEGDKVYAMRGDEGVVEGYTKNGYVCVKVGSITWICPEDGLTMKRESFFGGFDFSVRTGVVTEGSLVYMDTDSLFMQEYCAKPVGVAIEKEVETYTAPAFEIGMPVTCPPCNEDSVPIGTVTGFGDDETDVQVQIWGTRDVFEFDEAAIVPYTVRKFKEGDEVVSTRDGYHGTVVGYQGDRVEVRHNLGEVKYWGIYDERDLEVDTESKDDGTIVEASKDMTAEEKLGKVYEFAKELGVDVNEITGRSGCVGLVVRK